MIRNLTVPHEMEAHPRTGVSSQFSVFLPLKIYDRTSSFKIHGVKLCTAMKWFRGTIHLLPSLIGQFRLIFCMKSHTGMVHMSRVLKVCSRMRVNCGTAI